MQCGRHFKVPAGDRLPVGVMHKSTYAIQLIKLWSCYPAPLRLGTRIGSALNSPPPLPGPYTATIQSFAEHPHTFSPSQRWALTSFSSMQALVSLLTPTRSLL